MIYLHEISDYFKTIKSCFWSAHGFFFIFWNSTRFVFLKMFSTPLCPNMNTNGQITGKWRENDGQMMDKWRASEGQVTDPCQELTTGINSLHRTGHGGMRRYSFFSKRPVYLELSNGSVTCLSQIAVMLLHVAMKYNDSFVLVLFFCWLSESLTISKVSHWPYPKAIWIF